LALLVLRGKCMNESVHIDSCYICYIYSSFNDLDSFPTLYMRVGTSALPNK
jgi:hypothetical protein